MSRRQDAALVVVATPIGNLGDLSPRAIEAMAGADVIACEDTRQVRKLLTHAGVTAKRLMAVHARNEAREVTRVLAHLGAGRTVALVTDAGTPGISDPGQKVVAAAADAGHAVVAVPGPSAFVAALVVSGLPTRRFVFEGFLPRKGGDRSDRLAAITAERRTTVLYEAANRVLHTVEDLAAACGPGRRVAVARELTKVHEEVWRGTLEGAVAHLAEKEPRGEHVIVLKGAAKGPEPPDDEIEASLRALLSEGAEKRSAVSAVAADLDVAKRRVYDIAVRLGQ